MATSIKEKLHKAGQGMADTARNMGQKTARGAQKVADFAKEKTGMGTKSTGSNLGVAGIKEHMRVIASCGKAVGKVDGIEGETIKLTKNDSPDGHHHFIPVSWVERVDTEVHLKKNSEETEKEWKTDATSCGCG